MSPVYNGPADYLIHEGAVVQRGQPVEARGKQLDRLKALGHQFAGHDQPAGPAFVDQPVAPSFAMGADGGPISPAEVLASSSEHIAAQHQAAVQEAQGAVAEQERSARRTTERTEAKRD
jgi:hypothetical protein